MDLAAGFWSRVEYLDFREIAAGTSGKNMLMAEIDCSSMD